MKTIYITFAFISLGLSGCQDDYHLGPSSPEPSPDTPSISVRDTAYWMPDKHFLTDTSLLDLTFKYPDASSPSETNIPNWLTTKINEDFYTGDILYSSLALRIGGLALYSVTLEKETYYLLRGSWVYTDLILYLKKEIFYTNKGETIAEDSPLYNLLLNQKTTTLWSYY